MIKVREGEYELVFVLKAPLVEERDRGSSPVRGKDCPKSTYFRPKIKSGRILRAF